MISRLKLLLLIVEGHLPRPDRCDLSVGVSIPGVGTLARRPLWQSSRFWSGSPLL